MPAALNDVKGTTQKYLAAPIPRYLRVVRLSYLPLKTVIGFWHYKDDNNENQIFDVIMLPEDQFLRAKSYLAVPEMAGPDLSYGKFNPPYVVKDIKELVIPRDLENADEYARLHFIKEFKL